MKQADKSQLAKYRRDFCNRLKASRISAGFTQAEFADRLGIDYQNYVKYESRSLLPHHLVVPVADLTGVDVRVLLTGRRAHTEQKQTLAGLSG